MFFNEWFPMSSTRNLLKFFHDTLYQDICLARHLARARSTTLPLAP
jgi:hypothetical protein